MFFVFLLSPILIEPIIASPSTWDFDSTSWLSGDLSDSSELSTNQAASSNLALSLPLDATTSMFEPAQLDAETFDPSSSSPFSSVNTIDPSLWGTNTDKTNSIPFSDGNESVGDGLDNHFSSDNEAFIPNSSLSDLDDCSTSTPPFPAIGKSRFRRAANAESCKYQISDKDFSSVDDNGIDQSLPALLPVFVRPFIPQDRNAPCDGVSSHTLPWGVCSSGDATDISKTHDTFGSGHQIYRTYTLARSTLGMCLFFSYFLLRNGVPFFFQHNFIFDHIELTKKLKLKLPQHRVTQWSVQSHQYSIVVVNSSRARIKRINASPFSISPRVISRIFSRLHSVSSKKHSGIYRGGGK